MPEKNELVRAEVREFDVRKQLFAAVAASPWCVLLDEATAPHASAALCWVIVCALLFFLPLGNI